MTEWFKNVRQDFIRATLQQFGQVRRADLMREFGVSEAQAASDVAAFMANNRDFAEYCPRSKAYVIVEQGHD